jgi:hypothetical protein
VFCVTCYTVHSTYLGHLCDFDSRLAARSHGGAVVARGAGGLADGHLVLVHDAVAALQQRVGVLHLGHGAAGGRLLAPRGELRLVALQVGGKPCATAVRADSHRVLISVHV